MSHSKSITILLLSFAVVTTTVKPSHALISIGTLTKKAAKEKYGLTMHAKQNGDIGIINFTLQYLERTSPPG